MTDIDRCSGCGLPLDRSGPSGLCPACLLEFGRPAEGETTELAGPTEAAQQEAGRRIGPYRILHTLGEGGMGRVYLAEQSEPFRRRVAVKVVKTGIDTRQFAEFSARFAVERQALALMDHPNIASVFDAGVTEDGRPYVVMEYIAGVPITAYCDTHCLSTRARLQLFTHVCDAIQHAHQKGVIHRDLKPSNVLVAIHDGQPVPKVIDFGVAKATNQRLTEKTIFTEHGLLIGTPEYMSPEQAEMGSVDVDATTDIYSLGVLLYELLAGTLPFDSVALRRAGYAEIQRIIREDDPPRMSTKLSTLGATASQVALRRHTDLRTLRRELSGDLDWITIRAMEKDRTRRYASASEMTADITRHLTDEPVVARPPSAAYRLKKLARRHRGLVAASGLVAVSLLTGLIVSTLLYLESDRARRDGARQLYTANLYMAGQAWEQRNIARVQQLLQETEGSPYRGFEWFYWQSQMHLPRMTLKAHTFAVWAVAISPDGQRIATGGDQTVRMWEAASGRELLRLPTGTVWALAFSPDGQRIATGGDESAKVWDTPSGRELLTLVHHSSGNTAPRLGPRFRVKSIMFSRDGRRIATGGDDAIVKIWNAASGQEVLTLTVADKKGPGAPVAFSPDGSRLATANDRTATVWDAVGGRKLISLVGHRGQISAIAFSPGGDRLVTASWDLTAQVWDAASGRELQTLTGHTGAVDCVAFSPDGKRIATGGRDQIGIVWDADTGTPLLRLAGHASWVTAIAFSTDGRQVVTGSYDWTAKLWDLEQQPRAVLLDGRSSPNGSVVFSRDGLHVVTGSWERTTRVWEAGSGRPLVTLSGHRDNIWAVAFSADGHVVATGSGDSTAKSWDAYSGRELSTFSGHHGRVTALAFSGDDRQLATGSSDKTVKIWTAAGGPERLTLTGHTRGVWTVAFSSDGRRLVTGSDDGTAKIWDLSTGRELLTLRGHTSGIKAVAFSPDGRRVVTGSDDLTARVWDAANGRALLTLSGHTSPITSAAYSPDGSRIVTGGYTDGARVWEAVSGREILSLRGPTRWVAFSPDGQRILGGSDGQIRVWDAATRDQILAWHRADEARSVSVRSDPSRSAKP